MGEGNGRLRYFMWENTQSQTQNKHIHTNTHKNTQIHTHSTHKTLTFTETAKKNKNVGKFATSGILQGERERGGRKKKGVIEGKRMKKEKKTIYILKSFVETDKLYSFLCLKA